MNTNFYSKVYDILVEYGACAKYKWTFIVKIIGLCADNLFVNSCVLFSGLGLYYL